MWKSWSAIYTCRMLNQWQLNRPWVLHAAECYQRISAYVWQWRVAGHVSQSQWRHRHQQAVSAPWATTVGRPPTVAGVLSWLTDYMLRRQMALATTRKPKPLRAAAVHIFAFLSLTTTSPVSSPPMLSLFSSSYQLTPSFLSLIPICSSLAAHLPPPPLSPHYPRRHDPLFIVCNVV